MSFLMSIKGLFESKEAKIERMKYALRSATMAFKQWDRALERRKNNFYALAKKARAANQAENFKLALVGIRMCNKAQERERNMEIRVELFSTMVEIGTMSNKFISLLGKTGNQIQKVLKDIDVMTSHADLNNGIRAVESTMEKLEAFMSDNMDMATLGLSDSDAVTDDEITRMIDGEIAGKLPESKNDDLEEYIRKLAK